MTDSLIGVWTLKAFEMQDAETGERSEPFGPSPRGTLIFHPDGRMAAILTPGQPAGASAEAGQPAAAQQLVAYSGPFRLEPGRFVTAVDVAWLPAWVGTEQARTYRLEGDRLELVLGPYRMPRDGAPDVTMVGVQSWTREAATPNGTMAETSD